MREKIAIVVMSSIIVIIPIAINFYAINTWAKVKAYEAEGKTTTATVLKTSMSYGRYTSYDLTLSWGVENTSGEENTFEARIDVDSYIYNLYSVGDTLSVLYLPHSPHEVHISYNDVYLETLYLIGIIDLLLIITGVVFIKNPNWMD